MHPFRIVSAGGNGVPPSAILLYAPGMTDATDRRLAEQYEAYPYPKRDPRDEAKRLAAGSPSHLREIDHWVFGASRPASRPLNALIAGGGTGDATIMLAQQMTDLGRGGQVTWLDRASAALAIAKARAQVRKLTNIVWEQRSLLELPGSALGPFDYIDCCGVLHHLPDPAQGLRALLSDETYRAFEQAIASREKAGETQISEIKSIERGTLDAAELKGRIGSVTVRIVSDQISYTKDKDGRPVAGTDAVTEITDIWTFERDLSQSDPTWRLVAARSG